MSRSDDVLRAMGCLADAHDLWLVGLAIAVCATACLSAVNMLARRDESVGRASLYWQIGAGLCFGLGIWATHFIAMLASNPSVPVAYDIVETVVSALIAVGGSILALAAASIGQRAIVLGGCLLGGSIGAMHFIGASAMRFPGLIVVDLPTAALAVLLGMALCTVALVALAAGHRLVASTLLVVAVCTTHFTGMAATTLELGLAPDSISPAISPAPLAVTIAAVAVLVLGMGILASLVDSRLSSRAAIEGRRLQQLASATFEGILIHRKGIVLDMNESLTRLVGTTAEHAKGRSFLDFVAPEDHDRIKQQLSRVGAAARYEIVILSADGTRRQAEILAGPIETDTGPAIVVAVRDLTERNRAETRIRHMAHHDALTGLPNRVLMAQRLAEAIEIGGRNSSEVAVLCLDLDRFKAVNDQLGHHGGDQLLIQVALRLRECVRASDTVARLGGDEFAIVMPLGHSGMAIAEALARRIVDSIAGPFMIENAYVTVGTSIGLAIYPEDGAVADTLMRNADTAMYGAKAAGRGTHQFFEARMEQRMVERREMERDLRNAIALGQMEVNYQAIHDCSGGGIIGYEALLRWNHPTRGNISPVAFIPLAEETGLIVPIGRWALETACAEAATWEKPLRIAVNLSPVQFRHPDLVTSVETILARTKLAPARLELEVTEGVLLADGPAALDMFTALRRLDIRIALDDFGSGYSSMSYLRQFPFDKIKIDRAFVHGVDTDEDAAAIVDAILVLARGLHMDVTAEGVETAAQLGHLRARNCQQVQGFFLGRPIPASQLPAGGLAFATA